MTNRTFWKKLRECAQNKPFRVCKNNLIRDTSNCCPIVAVLKREYPNGGFGNSTACYDGEDILGLEINFIEDIMGSADYDGKYRQKLEEMCV